MGEESHAQLEYAIREHLADYLTRDLSLSDFEDWFLPETWDIDEVENPTLLNLVYDSKLRLAEYTHGDWTEEELCGLLRPYLEHVTIGSTPYVLNYDTSTMTSVYSFIFV